MSLTPVQRAESLLANVVEILYAAFRANDYPESYIRNQVPIKIRERLHELRTLKTPAGRVGPAQTTGRPTRRPRSAPAGADLARPGVEELTRSMLDCADRRLTDAVDALWESDAAFAERYLENVAQKHMAACLLWTRARETPSERAALVAEVNALRESVGLAPLDGEQVTALPGMLLRRGVGERRAPGERHRPRALGWRYPQLFQGDRRPKRRPAATKWRRPAAAAIRRRRARHVS